MDKLELVNNKLNIFFIIIGLFFFIVLLAYIWNLTVDDAFISFRYALHLAQGYGLVWNIGEPPVEGYSNFLWVVILSAFIYLKLDPVIISKIIGLLSVFGILIYYWKFTWDLFSGKKNLTILSFSLAFLFFLANPATALHTVAGLETMLYAFLMIALIYYTYKIFISPENKYYWLFALFALLLSLLRFEGILITIGLLILIVIFNYRKNHSFIVKKNTLIPILTLFFIPMALYMIFRFQYFHDLIPLPYYAKSISGNILITIKNNIYDIYSFYLMHIIPFLFVIFLVFFGFKMFLKDPQIRKKYFSMILILIFSAVAANIIYLSTALAMNYGDRLFYPTYIFIYLISGIALTLIFTNSDIYALNPLKKMKYSKTIIQVIVVFFILAANLSFMSYLTYFHEYEQKEYSTQVKVGQVLEPFSAYNYTVATDYAGAIPYYSKWHHIDMLGLNDKNIAMNRKPSIEYVRQVHPDLIIIPLNPDGKITNEDFTPFLEYAEDNNYTIIKSPGDEFIYYLNPGIKYFNEIKESLTGLK